MTAIYLQPTLWLTSLVLLVSLGWSNYSHAAACSSPGSFILLTTQAEVDALGATGCDSIPKSLIVEGGDISNLDALINITNVGRSLFIANNTALSNLDGLANITSVDGALAIEYNDTLTRLDGLTNLSSVGSLGIWGNDALTNIDAFANITSVSELQIYGNDALTNLDGLVNITSVGGRLSIMSSALTNLNGLANLASVGGYLYIDNNGALDHLNDLANITSVGGDLYIVNNDVLTNLDGLDNITSIGGYLHIGSNDALTDIDGLANVTNVGDYMRIANNDVLTNIDGLANITSVGGYLNIESNDILTNLDGLASLASVGGDLTLRENTALTNLDGLANVTNAKGHLYIEYNNSLTNLDGLASLASVGGFLEIGGNPVLTNLDGLASLASVEGYLFIQGQRLTNCQGVAPVLGWPSGPPKDAVTGAITVGSSEPRCNSIKQILASVSGPTKPTLTAAQATGGSSIELDFSLSTTTDALFPITGYEAACIGASAELTEAPAAALLDNTPVTRTLMVSGYDPVSVLSDIEVDIDITHSDPTDLYITLTTPQGTELVLWDQGGSGGEDIAGTFPTTLTPIDTISSVGRQAMDGNWVLRVEDVDVGPLVREGVLNAWGVRISENLTTAGSGSPISVNGVTRGRDYSCTVAPVTGLGTLPLSDAVTAKSDFPTAPTVTSTDYEDGTIRLTVSVADNGGADITEYSASCTDGTSTFTGTSSTPTIEVTGLTNGTAYTCSASATNAVGSSGASASTDSITPEALPTGLPIWLLYEATK